MIIRRFFFSLLTVFLISLLSCTNAGDKDKIANASRNLGEAYLSEGNYTLALKELLKAERLNDNDPYLHNDLGLAYMGKEKVDLAIEHFKKAISLNRDYADAKNNLGIAYLQKKDWPRAIDQFKEVSENLVYATPHKPLYNLGWCYYNTKEYSLAEVSFNKALDLKPDFIAAMGGLGKTYIALGMIPEAIRIFKKGVELNPNFPQLRFDLAQAYLLSREPEKAIEHLKQVVELAGDSPLAKDAEDELKKIAPR